jgi:hypothetical protein
MLLLVNAISEGFVSISELADNKLWLSLKESFEGEVEVVAFGAS